MIAVVWLQTFLMVCNRWVHSDVQCLGADVVTVEHALGVELVDNRIHLVLSGLDVGCGGFHQQHAAGIGDQTFFATSHASVIDVGILIDWISGIAAPLITSTG